MHNFGLFDRVRRESLMLLLFFAMPPFAWAAGSVTLAWDASTDSDITSYIIYYGDASQNYVKTLSVSNVTQATVTGLTDGVTYYFAAAAVNSFGLESDYSNEVSYTVPLPENQPPTLNALSNLTINEDAGPQTVTLSGITSGAPNESQTLTVTATSSNTGLIPHPTVNYTSPNTTGSLTFTPVPNASGSATITVIVNDGAAQNNTVTRTFLVTVNDVNDPPTLNALSNLTINENAGPQTVTLSGITSGATNESQTLTVTATSSNTGLIPHPTVNYTSPNTTGSLTFTPVPNASGSATITVNVNDGGTENNTVAQSFTVTVTEVNNPPTISTITNQITTANTSTDAIPFTVTDDKTPAKHLIVSASSSNPALVPVANIVFDGSEVERTVTLTPLPGETGQTDIEITVDDGDVTASTLFTLTVHPTASRPDSNLTVSIATNGEGYVTPNLNERTLTPGQTYSVTAKPAPGQEFAGWTGSVNSPEPRLSFVFTSNLVFVANFVPSPFIELGGTYNGLFYEEDEVRLASSGSFTVTVTPRGRYSGKLVLGKQRHSFSGKLDLQLMATNIISPRYARSLKLELSPGAQPGRIVGQLTDRVWNARLAGDRAVFNARLRPAPFAGTYTLLIPGTSDDSDCPAGRSVGAVRVNAAGRVRLAGSLADGTKLSQSIALSERGEWPLYVALYSGNGSIISWLTFAQPSGMDIEGNLNWIKLPNAKARYYDRGFTHATIASGSIYVRPEDKLAPVLNLAHAEVTFRGGNLPIDVTNVVQLTPSKGVDVHGKKFTLSFSRNTGMFRGKVPDPVTGRSRSFQGAVFQNLNAGYGFLLGDDESSSVSIEP